MQSVLLNLDQLDLEDERLVRTDRPARRAARAVSEFRGYIKSRLAAFLDQLEPLRPSLDHAIQRKLRGFAPLDGTVEDRTVEQLAFVMHGHGVRRGRSLAG